MDNRGKEPYKWPPGLYKWTRDDSREDEFIVVVPGATPRHYCPDNGMSKIDSELYTPAYWTPFAVQGQKGAGMLDQMKGYVSEYRDWFFTIVVIAVVDHFLLGGALKEKLTSALGKKLDDTANPVKP